MIYYDTKIKKHFYYKIENRQLIKEYLTDEEYFLISELIQSPVIFKLVLIYCRTKKLYKGIINNDYIYYKIIVYLICAFFLLICRLNFH